MKKQRRDSQNTRLRLLEAAGEVFSKKGFRDATHEDICSNAKANTAAVNYHFGSKENLYIEAWKYAFEKSIKKHPVNGGMLHSDSPEKRIKGRILSILGRITDPEINDLDIMHKEISNPTGLLSDIFSKTVGPIDNAFKVIIREYLGEGAGEEEVEFCFNSIMSQCFTPMLRLRLRHEEDPPIPPPNLKISDMEIEGLASYIIRFIFHGINSFRETSGK